MALTLRKMYSVTPQNIRRNSRAANTQLRSRGKLKKYARLGDVYEVIYKVKCTREWRNVTLRFMKKSPQSPLPEPSLTAPVWVRCTCPWFLFNCEYALSRSGSAWIHYSNGAPANQTNPKNIPFVCKHIYAVQAEIKAYTPTTAPFREPKRKTLPQDTLKDLLDSEKPTASEPEEAAPKSPFRETKRKTLPQNTLKNLLDNEKTRTRKQIEDDEVPTPPTPTNPVLTRRQERERDEAIDNIEEIQRVTKSQPAESISDRVINRVQQTLEDVMERIQESDTPIADQAAHEVKKLVRDVKNRGDKALSDSRFVDKLNGLIKRFRGF